MHRSDRGQPCPVTASLALDVTSWVSDLTKCYQVDDRALLDSWMAAWTTSEVIPVITSAAAAAGLAHEF